MKSKPLVYGCGPISGCSYEECVDWRDATERRFAEHGVLFASPMRNKSYLRTMDSMPDQAKENLLSTARGIMTRDFYDCCRCDLLFANLLGATRVSIGSVMEIAWCWQRRIPVVLIMEKEGNLHQHAMIEQATGFWTDDLNHGIDIALSVLAPAITEPSALHQATHNVAALDTPEARTPSVFGPHPWRK